VNAPLTLATSLDVKHLGLVDYMPTWELQREIQNGVIEGNTPNTLLMLEHNSVYTAGRRTEIQDRPVDGTPVVDTDRGGKITWHGPGQLIGYPIIKLRNRNDVVGFVREIETSIIAALSEFGIASERYCERSGVWLRDNGNDRKISAIGIRVAKGVTIHGFSLNVNPDLTFFDRINPCGFTDSGVTSMAKELGREISIAEVLPVVERHVAEGLAKISL
jgi:lipoyl(octanoyl) transferase